MTVKELEQALGMSRANIRFYEKEGLLSPLRLENGYRDYTPDDLETLRKIKLLRQLQVPVEDIRALQQGGKELTALLAAQEEDLRRRASDLEAARTLCRRMEADQVSYRDLDAVRYLEEMERLERGGARFQSVEADALPTVSHPWRRFFARSLDFGLCRLLLNAVLALGFRFQAGDGLLWTLLMSYLTWAVQFVLEPLLLSTWGYTPGKWVLGLTVRNAEGGKLSFSQAAARLAGVFCRGEGYGIPLYNLYRNYKCYRACDAGEPLPWEEEQAYTIRDLRALRCLGLAAAYGAVMGLGVLVGLYLLVPPVRGPLTVAGFARNYNDVYGRYFGEASDQLDVSGTWQENGAENAIVFDWTGGGSPPAFDYTLSDGVLTAVSFQERAPELPFGSGSRPAATVLALLCARSEVGLFNWRRAAMEALEQMGPAHEDYSFTCYGLTVTNQADYTGYETVGDYLWPVEGETQTFRQTFSVTLAE